MGLGLGFDGGGGIRPKWGLEWAGQGFLRKGA